MPYTYLADFQGRNDLSKYGNNAILLYALQLKYDIDDIDAVASESLTDGYEDKKCDLIYIDNDEGFAIVAQGYMKQNPQPNERAKLNKASDLNAAAAWAFSRESSEVPEIIRSAVCSLQNSIRNNNLTTIYFWYCHNCDESMEIADELKTVQNTARAHLQLLHPENKINVYASEIGNHTLDKWYLSTENKILVSDEINFPKYPGFEVIGERWKAYQTSIQGKQLYDLFKTYGEDDLFSANPRRFLGVGKRKSDINTGIKKTAEECPGNFWVYNNGITALVHNYTICDECLKINGISIINGAQTTGALGSLSSNPSGNIIISVRFVVCNDTSTIGSIISNNNRQNEMIPSDFRSNDQCQERLRHEFDRYSNIYYSGGLRSSSRNRGKEVLDPGLVAQVLLAYNGNPVDAYSSKSEIWSEDRLYGSIFNDELSAEHVIFVYSLMKAIDAIKMEYRNGLISGTIAEKDQKKLAFLSKRGSRILLLSMISRNLETLSNRRITNLSSLRFSDNRNFNTLVKWWIPVVHVALPFHNMMVSALSAGGLDSKDKANEAISQVSALIDAVSTANQSQIKDFTDHLVV